MGASPVTSPIKRINIWARVRSPGPLMADKAGARGNPIHADEHPARKLEGRERRGSGDRKGQCGKW